ncbi:MAG: Anti-ECFsigma factor ChrR [Rhodobacteraceae bacterium]|uniref:ChrR family anti-sigma-E factor n=1 Tax=Cypionkella sp. TaxID=2811411 RepID=UPI001325C2BB|nr:ChrR family anti-sigma-E factor [Cypionkella sp.]KAF0174588.1 MAG: Anti-ECFsigma factor ChrR [Paracoccaceae bacterium]MDO8328399.1 ChrR family anti-sigma-E factor [Cypionkella sp.]
MNIRHHLSDPLLIAYAAGNLPEAFGLVAATHISMCDDCRARLGAFEAVGGALVEAESVALSAGCLEATLARLGMPETTKPLAKRSNLPAPLADYIGGDLAAVKWKPLGMGVRQAILPTGSGASARLLHIPAGQAVPDHGHRGTELTLVLRGAFRDATDRFGPGDLEIASEDLEHTPVAEAGEDCICLAATDAPLRFKALLPRLLQPLFRI